MFDVLSFFLDESGRLFVQRRCSYAKSMLNAGYSGMGGAPNPETAGVQLTTSRSGGLYACQD